MQSFILSGSLAWPRDRYPIHPTVRTAYIHAAPLCFSDSNHVLLKFVGNLRKKMFVFWFYFTLFTCAAEGSHEIVG